MQVVSIPTDLVDMAWPRVESLLDAACRWSRDPLVASDLRDRCKAGQGRLLLAVRDDASIAAAGVVHVGTIAGETVCEILACAGERLRDWLPGLAEVEAWARWRGASRLSFAGRPGWARMLPAYRLHEGRYSKDLL